MTKEKLFLRNQAIAYKIANSYYTENIKDFEDIKQTALLGLWQAVLTFKKNTSAFSTYAYCCIRNEINIYLRRKKKYNREISTETKIGEGVTIADTLQDKKDYFEIYEAQRDINDKIKRLTPREQMILKKMSEEKTQKQIAKEMGLSQSGISRIKKKIKEKLVSEEG